MTTMKERPILFSAPMIKAILEGKKVQTPRVVRATADLETDNVTFPSAHYENGVAVFEGILPFTVPCPYGKAGDRLWVRETFHEYKDILHCTYDTETAKTLGFPPHVLRDGIRHSVAFRADHPKACMKWTPAIHMPRTASRLLLSLSEVRVQRVQDISSRDALAEGVNPVDGSDFPDPVGAFQSLWNDINGKREGCSFEANPWVWALTFDVVQIKK